MVRADPLLREKQEEEKAVAPVGPQHLARDVNAELLSKVPRLEPVVGRDGNVIISAASRIIDSPSLAMARRDRNRFIF